MMNIDAPQMVDGATILYVDDDEALGFLLRKNLSRLGFNVISATDGRSGLARLAEGGIDAIALDHYLAGETGLDILPSIVSDSDHPPVVYVTGSGDTSIAVEALKCGAEDYVTKNVSSDFFQLLGVAFRQALERARFRREAAAAQETVRQARDRAELLLREVNHRVANSLGLAASLIRMQTSLVSDPVAIAALQETQMRIQAIGKVHRHLYTSKEIGVVDVDGYLKSLLNEVDTSMHDDLRPHSISVDVEPVQLATDKAVSLGLIVSELVTNAFKYAYADGGAGEIRVRVRHIGDGRVLLAVEDDGRGFDPKAPAIGTGLGTKILNAMASTMGATLAYDLNHRPGTRAVVTFSI